MGDAEPEHRLAAGRWICPLAPPGTTLEAAVEAAVEVGERTPT